MPSEAEQSTLLPCRVGAERFVLDAAQVTALEPDTARLQRNPAAGAPFGWWLGNEEEVEVYSLAERLEVAPAKHSPAAGAVVMLSTARGRWGLLVDEVLTIALAGDKTFYTPPRLLRDLAAGRFAGIWCGPQEAHWMVDCEGLLGDPAERPAESPVEPPAAPRADQAPRLLSFAASGVSSGTPRFAVSLTQVVEVVLPSPRLELSPLPSPFAGVVDWRGELVPMFDLARFYGRHDRAEDAERLLIVRAAGLPGHVALPVRRDPRPIALPAHHRPVEARGVVAGLLGAFEVEGDELWLPDLDRLCAV